MRMDTVKSCVGSSLNFHLMRVGICIRFPLLMTALNFTGCSSGINLFQPKLTVLNQN